MCTQTEGAGITSENVDTQADQLTAYSHQEGKSSQCRGGRKIWGQKREKRMKQDAEKRGTSQMPAGAVWSGSSLSDELSMLGLKHKHWWVERNSLSSWCFARTWTQMLTKLFMEYPSSIFSHYCLKCFYKYLNSCTQHSEGLAMSTIYHKFLQQRKEKQMIPMVLFTLTSSSHCAQCC